MAKYFGGGLSIPDMMQMTFKEVMQWYKEYERQMAEESVIRDYANNKKEVPMGIGFEKVVNRKIAEWNKPLEV